MLCFYIYVIGIIPGIITTATILDYSTDWGKYPIDEYFAGGSRKVGSYEQKRRYKVISVIFGFGWPIVLICTVILYLIKMAIKVVDKSLDPLFNI